MAELCWTGREAEELCFRFSHSNIDIMESILTEELFVATERRIHIELNAARHLYRSRGEVRVLVWRL